MLPLSLTKAGLAHRLHRWYIGMRSKRNPCRPPRGIASRSVRDGARCDRSRGDTLTCQILHIRARMWVNHMGPVRPVMPPTATANDGCDYDRGDTTNDDGNDSSRAEARCARSAAGA